MMSEGSDNGPDRNKCNVGPGPTMDRKGLNGDVLIHSKATRTIVPEDNTDLNGSIADPQAPYQPQGSLVCGEPWSALST
ncbi:UNVERIFIED_CONTAM: hypothetical protein FKN15_072003 [Acipenser sinensis]